MNKEGKLQTKYTNQYKAAKKARENADYSYTHPERKAKEILSYTEEFNEKLENITGKEVNKQE